ncbi:MAG: hypothetical protein JRF63_01850 [Deltaproteobacteria bacterium]|nr:hypothetical protein [Deltaproteobacteria bacterium]
MIRSTVLTALAFAILLPQSPASADALDRATQEFMELYAAARFVEDGSSHRWYIVHGFATAKVVGDHTVAAERFLIEHRALLGLDNAASGVAFQRVVRHRAHRYFQFEQTFGGLPVFGAGVIVQIDGSDRIVKASSKAVGFASDNVAGLAPSEATEAAQVGLTDVDVPLDVTLGYLPEADSARLVYRVVARGAPQRLWQTFVDARSGIVVMRQDLVKHHDANVFLENPVVDSETTTEVFLPNIEAGAHENHTFGSLARAATCTETDEYGACIGWEHQAVADTNGFLDELPLLDDPTASPDGFAEVMAYYHLDEQNQWVRDEFGYNGVYVDMETLEEGDHIWIFTSLDWPNAAYMGGWSGSPDSIIMGQGALYTDTVDFSYDGDVVRHEFTHSVSDKAFTIRWGQRDEMGFNPGGSGVGEGIADYFAVTVLGNPTMSEYALGDSGRNLDNDRLCPDDMIGESHHDGWIVGGALWEIREGIGATKTDHMTYGGLAGATVRTFEDMAAALIAQAEAMQSEVGELQFTAEDVALVEDVFAARGMDDCYRVVSLWEDSGPVEKEHFTSFDMTDGLGTPSAIQFLAPTFEDSAVLELSITPYYEATYDVLVRVGEPVIYTWSDDGWPFSWDAEYDHKWTGPLTEATISNITALELEPGEEYYFSIACRATLNGCWNSVTMSLSDEPEEDPDAGPDADTDADSDADADAGPDAGPSKKSDSGCGCRVGGTSVAEMSLMDLVLALF